MVLEQKRQLLHQFLCKLLGSSYCYYSPPTGLEMVYPCIVYDLANMNVQHADNLPYFRNLQWTVTVIDEDPDSEIADHFFHLPKCRFDRGFSSNDLNQFVFTLYF